MRFNPWMCPQCGQAAKGTLDTIPGVALLTFDEHGNAEYFGQTDVCWDNQTSVVDDQGRVKLLCPDGHQWPATCSATIPADPNGLSDAWTR